MQKLFIVIALICFSLATAAPHHGRHHRHGSGHHHRPRRSDPGQATGGEHSEFLQYTSILGTGNTGDQYYWSPESTLRVSDKQNYFSKWF
ncbi:unnamed protein product [Rotaria socialis]|uniref:Uncharacterized protein n=1 Tax=Rotaria socialis TaxID=392032 RepID=A0A817QBY5_9BILA|nr:unnamed protein product [Rotaria socialis]